MKTVSTTSTIPMYKIAIFGSNGQVGTTFRHLSDKYSYQFIFLNSSELDITDRLQVLEFVEKNKPNFIINCAAYTAVDKAESDTETAYLINETGTKNIADACAQNGTHFIHISTDFVYEGLGNIPFKENDHTGNTAVYATSKLAGEKTIIDSNCNYSIFRISWVYSPYGNNFVKTMLRLAKERGEINVVNDQIGNPTYAYDFAKFILDNIAHIEKQQNEIFNYSNEGEISWYHFAAEIMKIKDLNCKIHPITTSQYPTPAKRPSYSAMDKSKVKSHFNIAIPHWKESLIECLRLIPS